MKYDFSPKGVCARRLEFELDGDIVKNVQFMGGCNGNLKALAALTEGMTVDCKGSGDREEKSRRRRQSGWRLSRDQSGDRHNGKFFYKTFCKGLQEHL